MNPVIINIIKAMFKKDLTIITKITRAALLTHIKLNVLFCLVHTHIHIQLKFDSASLTEKSPAMHYNKNN